VQTIPRAPRAPGAERGDSDDEPRHGSPSAGRQLARLVPLLMVGSLSLAATAPILTDRMIRGHDAFEHVTRTAEYARAVSQGAWWPQWAPNLGHGYGEPVFLFNPPLFYTVATIPTLAGLPVTTAINLACVFLIVVAGLGAYAWTARLFGRAGALVAATAYVWSPYLLLDLYVRQALTELAAVCVLPWALWGLSRTCLLPGSQRLAQAAVAVGLLLLASTPATLVTAPALLGQVGALAIGRRPASAVRGLAAVALGALMAAAFWVPAATERHLLRFDRLLDNRPAYYNHFLEPWQLFSADWGYGQSLPGPADGMGFGLGWGNLLLAACAIVLLALGRARGLIRRQVWFGVMLVVLGAALALEWSAPFWTLLPEIRYLQFPWRFLLLAALGCALLAGAPVALFTRERPRLAAVLATLCIGLIVQDSLGRARPSSLAAIPDIELSAAAIADRDRGRGTAYEYETIWTEGRPEKRPTARLVARSGSATIVELHRSAHHERFSVAARGRARLRLNTFYFPGWRVLVNGREHPIDWNNPSGLIELSVDRGEHVVEARFEPTPARQLGRALSIVALLLVGLLMLGARRRPLRLMRQAPRSGDGAPLVRLRN